MRWFACGSMRWFACGILSLISAMPTAEATESSAPIKLKTQNLELTGGEKPVWEGELDLGSLASGERFQIPILIPNLSGIDLTVDSITTSCNCSKATITGKEWDASTETKLVVELETPTKSEKELLTLSVIVNASNEGSVQYGRVVVVARLKLRLNGLLNFRRNVSAFEWNPSESVQDFRIPILCTIEDPDLSIEGDYRLADSKFESGPDGMFLRVTVAEEMLGPNGFHAEFLVRDKSASGAEAKGYLMVNRTPAIRISPAMVRFKEKDGRFTASLVLRLAPSKVKQSKIDDKPHCVVEAAIGDAKLEAVVTALSSSIYRVRLAIPVRDYASIETMPDKLTLSTITSDSKYQSDVPFRFVSFNLEK